MALGMVASRWFIFWRDDTNRYFCWTYFNIRMVFQPKKIQLK
ncbi:Uncharacterised protein [Cronobacter sakazakii]|nr:Uncharacterised protein [Cronobacter sakazakii]